MQTRQAFLVFDFIHGKENNESRIYGVFDNRKAALAHAEMVKKEDVENNVNPQVMPIHMHIGNEENECESFDFRKHIAFDVTQMESPVKCDVCIKHATHFCMAHRGAYCESHITNHEDNELGFLNSTHGNVVRYTDDSVDYIPKTVVFSEEDVDLVSQQAGVNREKARSALIEAKGDLARAILLLTTG